MDAYSLSFQRDLTVHFHDLFATYWRHKQIWNKEGTASILKQGPVTRDKLKRMPIWYDNVKRGYFPGKPPF